MSGRGSGLRSEIVRIQRTQVTKVTNRFIGESGICQRVGLIPQVDYPLVICCDDENPDKLGPRWLSAPFCFQKAPRRMQR